VRVKAYDHGHPPEWTHDPTSGKALWRDVKVCALGDDNEGELEDVVQAAGLEVFSAGCSEDDDADLYIGVGVRTGSGRGGDYVGFRPHPNFGEIQEKLWEFLSPRNLWNERDFGLWSLLYVGI
jgi:hypothetical protein